MSKELPIIYISLTGNTHNFVTRLKTIYAFGTLFKRDTNECERPCQRPRRLLQSRKTIRCLSSNLLRRWKWRGQWRRRSLNESTWRFLSL